jgi:hypothetical protein
MAPRGVYRERNEWGNGQNSVVVNYGTSHFDVTEDKYREDGYQPPFEELPWKTRVRSTGFGPDIVIAYLVGLLFGAFF